MLDMFWKSCVNSVQETLVNNALMTSFACQVAERLLMIFFQEMNRLLRLSLALSLSRLIASIIANLSLLFSLMG